MILNTLVHIGDSSTIPFWVRLGILLARGVILLPARGLGSRTIRLPMRVRRLHIANTGTISRMTRNIFVMLLWHSSTQEDWALGRFICRWTIHCCCCWSFCVLATTICFCTCPAYLKFVRPLISPGGVTLPPPLIRRLGYQSSFRLMMSANPLWFSYYRTKGRVT